MKKKFFFDFSNFMLSATIIFEAVKSKRISVKGQSSDWNNKLNNNVTILSNVSFSREFLPLSSPNEITFMIIYLFSQKDYSFTAVLSYKCGVLP